MDTEKVLGFRESGVDGFRMGGCVGVCGGAGRLDHRARLDATVGIARWLPDLDSDFDEFSFVKSTSAFIL